MSHATVLLLFTSSCQVANQPGLEDVFADLLEYEGEEEGESAAAAAIGDEQDTGAEFYSMATPKHLEGGCA